MLTFAICVACAGALLALVVRLPMLVLALGCLTVVVAGLVVATGAGNGAVAVLVAAVALQFGYGAAIVFRAVLARRQGRRGAAPLPTMRDYPVDATVQEGRSRNQP